MQRLDFESVNKHAQSCCILHVDVVWSLSCVGLLCIMLSQSPGLFPRVLFDPDTSRQQVKQQFALAVCQQENKNVYTCVVE